MPIRKLSPLLINQIAAGEVIERPASVVKELVENSLDAGGSRIDIVIEEGGQQLIRISDDGVGIPPDELPLAVAAHATSKLETSEDLGAIDTLGFRGEALASIASVSRLRITSRATIDGQAAEAGAVIEVSGADVSAVAPAACAAGTTIEVRDLFFNTPARRKFMRTASAEFGHIAENIHRLAMAYPHVAFSLTHNGRKTLDVAATNSRRQRCVELLGEELDEALLEFGAIADCGSQIADRGSSSAAGDEQPAIPVNPQSAFRNPHSPSIWGLAGLPTIARATAKFQYLFVNGRHIRDRSLAHAIKEAYRGLVPPDRQPVAVVFLEIDPTLVDVNVHPAKSEVRFLDGSRLHGQVLTAIRSRLLQSDLTPSATIFAGRSDAGVRTEPGDAMTAAESQASPFAGQSASPFDGRESGPFSAPAISPQGGRTEFAMPARSMQSEATAAPPPATSHIGGDFAAPFSPAAVRPAAAPHAGPSPSAPTHIGTVDSFVDYFRRMAPVQKGFAYQEVRRAMAETDPQVAGEVEKQAGPAGAGSLVPPVLRSFGVLQVHKSYLVTEDESGIIIIDQHALHERVMFEQLRKRVLVRNLESQRLLMPVTVTASARRQALLESLKPLLEKIGVEAEPMGPDTIAVHAFPTFLFDRKVEPAAFLTELLDQAEEEKLDATTPTALEAALHEVLDMMACKAAVKAGDKLTAEELASLLQQRQEIDRSSNCPHGRPTSIRVSLRELEKQFKRS